MHQAMEMGSEPAQAFRRRFARAALLLGLVWLGLNGTDLASWLIGVPALLSAAALATRFPPGRPLGLRWSGLLPFGLFFFRKSVLGGWDVALRVLGYRLRVAPGFVEFETALPPGPARHLFLNVISLLPGTVTADVQGDRIVIHALDVSVDSQAGLRELELRVAGLFVGTHRVRP
jgi:multicomponent Na+:H+ antiporter subunit E